MHRCSEFDRLDRGSARPAQTELVNPEKSQIATIPSSIAVMANARFRYAPLSSGLDIVRKSLGKHEIATLQATDIDKRGGTGPPDDASRPLVRRVDLIGLAGVLGS